MNIEQEVSAVVSPAAREVHTPQSPRAEISQIVRAGITAAKAGRHAEARTAFNQALEFDSRHETALMWLASISDKPHDLLEYLQRVLDINPANERAMQWAQATKTLLVKSLLQQGAASHGEGMPEVAAQYFQQAAEYEPENEAVWLWLATIAAEPEDKLAYLNRVLSINARHETALALFHQTKTQIASSLVKKANLAAVSGARETAREILRDVMDYNAELEEAWILKAFLSDGDAEKVFCYERVLQINPENDQASTGLTALHTALAAQFAADNAFAENFNAPSHTEADETATPEEIATALQTETVESDETNESVDAVEEPPVHIVEQRFAEEAAEENLIADEAAESQFNPNQYFAASTVVDEQSVMTDLVNAAKNDATDEEEINFAAFQAIESALENEPVMESAPVVEAPQSEFREYQETAMFAAENSESVEVTTPEAVEFDAPEVAQFAAPEVAEIPEAVEVVETVEAVEYTAPQVVEAVEYTAPQAVEAETFVAESAAPKIAEPLSCVFCRHENTVETFRCGSCGAIVRLENFDAIFGNEMNDEQKVRDFIEADQTDADAAKHFSLGLAYLNLRNVKKAVQHFEQTPKTPEITALLTYIQEKMPETLGTSVSSSGKTIMVVDDSPTVRKLIVGKLEKHGHKVIAAVDGMDALSKINEGVPDLILLDVTMPRLDGYQLCKLVKNNAKTKHVPVVMISGKDGFFDKVRGRMAGSTAYITKPFGPETLIQTVETYCA